MYYTTKQVADKMPAYNSARSLLEALGNNQNAKGEAKLKNDKELLDKLIKNKLSQIWNCRIREGKGWYHKKEEIDLILESK